MASLSKLKRTVEQVESARSASIEHDDYIGTHVEMRASDAVDIESLDDICNETGAVMKVEGVQPDGEYVYLFR